MTKTGYWRHLTKQCLDHTAPREAWYMEQCPRFITFMRNRLIVGSLRYGPLGAADKKKWNRMGSIRDRVDAYERDHNTEHLVDIANMALIEFVEGDGVLVAQDDGIHANVAKVQPADGG